MSITRLIASNNMISVPLETLMAGRGDKHQNEGGRSGKSERPLVEGCLQHSRESGKVKGLCKDHCHCNKKCFENSKFNAALFGLLGIALSITGILIVVLCTCGYPRTTSNALYNVLYKNPNILVSPQEDEQVKRLVTERVLIYFATGLSVASFANLVLSVLLVVGVVTHKAIFMLPWLYFHGIGLGVTLQLIMYLLVSCFYIQVLLFLVAVFLSGAGYLIYVKIFKEVFVLYMYLSKPCPLVRVHSGSEALERAHRGRLMKY